jgi:hypothetical protein
MEYNFKRIDVHYVTIEADSLEEAQAIADGTSCMDSGVNNEQGEWEPIAEE